MEQWEKNYYISSIAGANNGSSLVVMSKGMFYCMFQFLMLMDDSTPFLMERDALMLVKLYFSLVVRALVFDPLVK